MLEATARGRTERTIILAHQIEAMARQEKLKPVEQYLKRIRKPRRRPDQSAALAAAFDRLIAKQQKETPDGDA